ncbi:MAG TPA: VWA domain-containing protein, partial [Blastocatellia bacterium]|nr:VWA domain-containing protein [Blastocatellia bacterium]
MKALAPFSLMPAPLSRWRKAMCVSAVSVFVLSLIGAVPNSRAQGSNIRMETFQFKPNGQVRIENKRGSTRVEVWDDWSVQIVAEKKTPGKMLEAAELALMGAENSLLVQCRDIGRAERVDLEVYVPRRSHVEVAGGPFPIEVNGSLGSALVETTSGNIGYRLPLSDSARIAMHSAQGIVRTTVPMTVLARTGLRSLQGSVGGGGAPIILNSGSGQITLLPANRGSISTVTDDAVMRGGDRRVASSSEPYRPAPQSNQTRDWQTQGNPNHGQDDSDPNSIASGPQNGTPAPTGNPVIFGGGTGNRSGDGYERIGPLERKREESQVNDGNYGLSVRIIPGTVPVGGGNDRRGQQRSPVFDQQGPNDSPPDNRTQPDSGSAGNGSRYPSDSQPPAADIGSNSSGSGSGSAPVLHRGGPAPDSGGGGAAASPEHRGGGGDEAMTLESNLVNLSVGVTNRKGTAIGSLSKADFEVFENNEPQAVDFFSANSTPFNLVLLLDLSGSIQGKLDLVKEAALHFLDVIGPHDRVAVVTFAGDIRVISQLTADRNTLRKRIKTIDEAQGGTVFYEALWFALVDTLKGTKGQRNAVVAVT